MDFTRFRPAVICVETLIAGTRQHIPEIPAFMATKNYVVRGASFVNTIFVDGSLIKGPGPEKVAILGRRCIPAWLRPPPPGLRRRPGSGEVSP